MKHTCWKFVLAISLAFNLSILITVGYMHFKQPQYWTTPFGVKIEKDRFFFEKLSLQPEQMEKMRQRARSFRIEVDGKRKAIEENRKRLFALIGADQPEIPAIDATVDEISSMQEALQKTIVQHILGTKALLDEEQQKKLFNLIEHAMQTERQAGCLPQETY